MNEWTETGNGYRSKTIKRGNVTVVINRPILSEKERAKRENITETVLGSYAKSLSQSKAIHT